MLPSESWTIAAYRSAVGLDQILFKTEAAVSQLVLDGCDENEAKPAGRLEVTKEFCWNTGHNFSILWGCIQAEEIIAALQEQRN